MESAARPTVVAQLEQEWPLLARRELAPALARWRERQPSLRRFQHAEDLLVFLHGSAPHASDEPLLALLVLAADDRAAGRFVLQAILPALKAHARRLANRSTPRQELWELLLFYAWETICTYPVARRCRRVAANLVLDVLHKTTRELDRSPWPAPARPGRRGEGRPTRARRGRRQRHTRAVPRAALVRAAVRAGVISRRDASVIVRSRIDGVSLRALADTRSVPYVAVLKRRQRAEQTLRDWARVQADVRKRNAKVLTCSGPTRVGGTQRTSPPFRCGPPLLPRSPEPKEGS